MIMLKATDASFYWPGYIDEESYVFDHSEGMETQEVNLIQAKPSRGLIKMMSLQSSNGEISSWTSLDTIQNTGKKTEQSEYPQPDIRGKEIESATELTLQKRFHFFGVF